MSGLTVLPALTAAGVTMLLGLTATIIILLSALYRSWCHGVVLATLIAAGVISTYPHLV